MEQDDRASTRQVVWAALTIRVLKGLEPRSGLRLWPWRFDAVEGLRLALHAVKGACNQGWILQRHGCRTPAQVRAHQTALAWAA